MFWTAFDKLLGTETATELTTYITMLRPRKGMALPFENSDCGKIFDNDSSCLTFPNYANLFLKTERINTRINKLISDRTVY